MPEQTDQAAQIRDLTVTRILKAPPALVWAAFTDPDQIIKFFGPQGTTIQRETVTVDLEVGGEFSLVMSLDGTTTEFPMNAKYLELKTNERIVFEADSGITGTIVLNDQGDGTTELIWNSRGAFDDALYENAKIGTNSAVDQLEAHLAKAQN
jgi:uncharacterized protein YndB with AHSA1/START domain